MLKVPAVQRQMSRLTSIEVAVQAQALRLGTLEQTVQHLGAHLEVAASDNVRVNQGQAARLDAFEQTLQQLSAHLEVAVTDSVRVHQGQAARLDAFEQTLQQLSAHLEVAASDSVRVNQEQAGRLDALEQTLQRLCTHLEVAASDTARVNDAQVVRLDALEQTFQQVSAHQADLISRLESIVAAQAAPVDVPEPAVRPPVLPYTFRQLLDRDVERDGLDLVAHVHVPKAGGNTVNELFQQMGFSPLALDMNTNSFFGTIREDRWWDLYRAPPPRASYLLTGHLRLDHSIFRKLWIRHVIVGLLRDPVQRMLSNYNFTLRQPHNPWHDEVLNKGMSFLDYTEKMIGAIGPQYSFFDDTGDGVFAHTGSATPERCLDNLRTKVGIYGLTDRFNEFAVLAGFLLGRGRILAVPPMNVTRDLPESGDAPLKTSLTDDESRVLAKMLEGDIWFYDEARAEYERRISDPNLQALFAEVLPLVRASQEMAGHISLLGDPKDPGRRAFVRP